MGECSGAAWWRVRGSEGQKKEGGRALLLLLPACQTLPTNTPHDGPFGTHIMRHILRHNMHVL